MHICGDARKTVSGAVVNAVTMATGGSASRLLAAEKRLVGQV